MKWRHRLLFKNNLKVEIIIILNCIVQADFADAAEQ